ncbi:MAG: acyl-CoA dehydrogenase family protein [Proteobacteria bacterium]|nr:acyl-CoA dehydrogenase family protein [Pseudomonadota bacterium]
MTESAHKEIKMIEKAAREFSKKVLAPEREENDAFPFGPFFNTALEKAYGLDFFHLNLPENLGGMGQSIRALCRVMDQICREDSSLGGIIFTNTLSQSILLETGSESRLQSLAEKATGVFDFIVAFPSLTNPHDLTDLPKAQVKNDVFTLSGHLDYLVLGGMAKQAIIPACIDGNKEYSLFLVNLDSPDVVRSEPIMSHGLHACPAVDVTFSFAEGFLLGEAGKGDGYFTKASETMQLAASAMLLGVMKGSWDEAMSYCGSRVQGGRKLKDWSTMQMKLADMVIQVHVADMLVERACQAVENQEKDWQNLVKAAAFHIQSAATQLVTEGIQALGGVGYMKDFGQEKRFRDAGQIQTMLGHTHIKKLRFIKQFLN